MSTKRRRKKKGRGKKSGGNDNQVGVAWLNPEESAQPIAAEFQEGDRIRVSIDEEITLSPDDRVFLFPNENKDFEENPSWPDFNVVVYKDE